MDAFSPFSDEMAQLLLEPEDSLDALLIAAIKSYEDMKAVPAPTSPSHFSNASVATRATHPFAQPKINEEIVKARIEGVPAKKHSKIQNIA